jgi:SHS2 domain-containing protein
MYETFEHTADIGIRVCAETLEQLFTEAAEALFSLIVANPGEVKIVEQTSFRLASDQLDYLLFDWLNELLYTHETRRLLFRQFDVHLQDGRLEADVGGEPVDTSRHELDHEVKAITYHELKVKETKEGWLAEVILDI